MLLWQRPGKLRARETFDADVTFLRNRQAHIEESREEEVAGRGIQHRLSQLRFQDADWARLVQIWNEEMRMAQGYQQQIVKSCAALELPTYSEVANVNNAKERKPPTEDISNFVRLLASHRHFFAGMVFVKEDADQYIGFRLLFATQNPLRAFFLPVFPVDCEFPLLPHGMPLLERQRYLAHISLFEFEWNPSTYITDKGIGEMDELGKV